MIGDGEHEMPNGEILQRGYILSHFAKHVTGKSRIDAEATGTAARNAGLSITAYNGDNDIVIMIVNPSQNRINQLGFRLPSDIDTSTGKAIVTTESKNMEVTPISFDEKTPYTSIEPYSITTIVFN